MKRNYFTIKTKDPHQVDQVKNQKADVVISNLNVLSDKIQENDFVFVVFGGDKPTGWTPGLVALGHISKLPYGIDGRNFCVNIDIDLYFEPITRADLLPYPDTYGIIGIAPIIKWEPNQALSQISNEKAECLLQAILELRSNKSERVKEIVGDDMFKKLSDMVLHRYIIADSNLFSKKYIISNNKQPQKLGSHQIIHYGAPGTGKSFKIKKELEGVSKDNIFRTTFHPDSDYASFVGAYKPTMGKRPLYGLFGKETVRLKDEKDLSEDTIKYNFVPQAFLNAYMQAYRKPDEKIYLIIEEINRGNCAQIFGDLFQLLDRDAYGVSEYPIKADADLKSFLEGEFGEGSDAIKNGELCLPSNLYIYATMNTSDQSLFPIDSAFKRRWDWEYEPIKYKNTDWVIDIQGEKYSWVSFQQEINKRIFDATNSEDKMLGDFFVNPADGEITEKILLNKILFYLWNDVCKDGEGDIFRIKKENEESEITFSDFFVGDSSQTLINWMAFLNVASIGVEDDEINYVDDNSSMSKTYYINGVKIKKTDLAKNVFYEYVKANPQQSIDEVMWAWEEIRKKS